MICQYNQNKLFKHNIVLWMLCLQHSSPEIKWVDGGRPLFKVSTHLVSTIYTQV